jgi:hypothetical protein
MFPTLIPTLFLFASILAASVAAGYAREAANLRRERAAEARG